MMEKMSQNTRHTSNTLKIEGMAYIRAFTTIFIPCHREMALKGLRALRVLRDRNAVRVEFPSTARLMTETNTITKSRHVHTLAKYLFRPKAIHYRNISTVNKTANTRLTIFRMNLSSSLS